MAALALSFAGAAAGSVVFARPAPSPEALIGALAGNLIDQALFGARRERTLEGPRLSDLEVMASTEGAAVPRVYGRSRLSGQVIWATNLKEVVSACSRGCNVSYAGRDTKGLVGTGRWKSEQSASRYAHVVPSEDARAAVMLPVGRRST